jgi:hypothetical protein
MHSLHKAFKDHTWTWVVNMVGATEIDRRFQCMPRTPGYRCFDGGISKISQWSIKDARNVERYAVAAATGALDGEALRALRAEIDYIYTADWEQISERDLHFLTTYNKIFHNNKNCFIDPVTGGRRGTNGVMTHFNIPKLHMRHHIPNNIRDCGASRNFSAQITERYHIDIVKHAYAATNRRDVAPQMVRWLNRQERILQFDSYLVWLYKREGNNIPVPEVEVGAEQDNDDPDEDEDVEMPDTNGGASPHHLSKRPAFSNISLNTIAQLYQLSGLTQALCRYLQKPKLTPEWYKLDVWLHTSVELPGLPGDEKIRRERILARPGDGHRLKDRLPRFHAVFVDRNPDSSDKQDGLSGTHP